MSNNEEWLTNIASEYIRKEAAEDAYFDKIKEAVEEAYYAAMEEA